jgi:RNA polymerase sigma factor (sigma-70 family)
MLGRARTERSNVSTEDVDVPGRLNDDPGELALALLAQCLGTLPQRDRRALELRYFRQASPAEIAGALGVPEGDVRPIVFNGLTLLRSCMRARRA